MFIFSFLADRFKKHNFLFEELVKRDFKQRYKRTALGILWSLLGPLLQLLIMALVFTYFFGGSTPNFIIYIFSGNLIFSFFRQATSDGMMALYTNADIITKINAPKYLFLFSKNVAALINFCLTLVIFFIFVALDGIPFHPRFLLLLYPTICLLFFNIGAGLFLSAMFVFFRDTKYLYDIFTMLLMWLSAIFYPTDAFPYWIQQIFLLNPVFTFIHYFRLVIIHGVAPSHSIHLICAAYTLAALFLGGYIYKRYNYKFIFYL